MLDSKSFCTTIVVVLLSAGAAFGQVGSGALTGVIRDQSGAAMPGVTVTITDAATGRQRVAVSSSDGVYAAASLSPGGYRVAIELTGFRAVTRDGIRVTTGEVTRIDFEMAVGVVTDIVTVTAEAPALRSERASLGHVVEQERIQQLPLNGRTFITLAALAPGVALPPELAVAAHQWRAAANERVSLRRDFRSAAGTRSGRVLPGGRCDRGIQDREQQRAGGVRQVQRRRHQPHDEGRHEHRSRQRVRVPSQ